MTPVPSAEELLEQAAKMEKVLAENYKIDPDLLKKFSDARHLVSTGDLAKAEETYAEIRVQTERLEASLSAAPLAWTLFVLELAYLLLLLTGAYFAAKWPNYWMWDGIISIHTKTAWFGALGGVAVGLFGLYTHIQLRDFDREFRLWYISKPIVGAIFGWFVVLVFRVGLVSIQGHDTQNQNSPLLFYVIAFLAGFSERFTIKIIDRLMQVLTTWEEKPTGTAPKTPPAPKV